QQESDAGPAGPDGLAAVRTVAAEALSAAARLLGADEDETALTHGTTEGVNIVLHGLDWMPGDELVTAELEHPALAQAAAVLEQRRGVIVRRVEFPADASPEQMLNAVEGALSGRTRVVALSHVQYSCGLRMPAREIADAARHAGALVLYDGAQTGGHLRLDMRETGADFYAVSGQKWLLGPSGTGALFVRREAADWLRPLFAPSAERGRGRDLRPYEMTSHSPAALAGFAEAIAISEELGMDAIEERTRTLGDRLREALASVPGVRLTGPSAPETSCGLVSIAVDGLEPQDLAAQLWEESRVAARTVRLPAAVRFSTAHFNDEDDLARAEEAVARAAKRAAAS
ncbi:MAG: aminotransferase class V-fold PLP-dependent enzyme, partial [Chloroflexota bacterium]|nr:aminotransferase class V-fold PLP-dependent enzyme [Chloroflexota bacterium]